MLSDVAQWLKENSLFCRKKELPLLGFRYNTQCTTVFGIVPFNSGGFANVQRPPINVNQAVFGAISFQCASTLTRVELSISVRSNTNNAYIGAMVVANPGTDVFDFTGSAQVLVSNITNSTTADISKNFSFGAYSGFRFESGDQLFLAVVGDATGICGVTLNYHWLSCTGKVVATTDGSHVR